MRFEVRALRVDFLAALEVALVHFASSEAVGEIAERRARVGERRRRVPWRGVDVRAESVVGRVSVRRARRRGRERPLTQGPRKKAHTHETFSHATVHLLIYNDANKRVY